MTEVQCCAHPLHKASNKDNATIGTFRPANEEPERKCSRLAQAEQQGGRHFEYRMWHHTGPECFDSHQNSYPQPLRIAHFDIMRHPHSVWFGSSPVAEMTSGRHQHLDYI
jgi:hypothetical protein